MSTRSVSRVDNAHGAHGRPSILNAMRVINTDKGPQKRTVREIILAAVTRGMWLKSAAALAGVHEDTLSDWKRKGARGIEPYASFLRELVEAEAQNEIAAVGAVQDGIKDDPRLALDWLRVRHRSKGWQDEAERDAQPLGSVAVQVNNYNLGKMSVDELRQLRSLAEKLQAADGPNDR